MKHKKREQRLFARRRAWEETMKNVRGTKWARGYKEPGSLSKSG